MKLDYIRNAQKRKAERNMKIMSRRCYTHTSTSTTAPRGEDREVAGSNYTSSGIPITFEMKVKGGFICALTIASNLWMCLKHSPGTV